MVKPTSMKNWVPVQTAVEYLLPLREILERKERNEYTSGSIFNMTCVDLRLALNKHIEVLSSNRRFICEHQNDIMAWFSRTMKQFTTVVPSEEYLCEELTEEYILKCKKNQARASKDWGQVRVECPCGGDFRRDNKKAHCRTKNHSDWLVTDKEKRKRDDDNDTDKRLREDNVVDKVSKSDLVEDVEPIV